MTDTVRRLIPETAVDGRRLGRHVHHDPRSRNYPAAMASTIATVRHRHYGPVLQQGNLGSCTGNAMVDALMTSPLRTKAVALTEADAVSIYSRATVLDDAEGLAGQYPPTDTGSDGLSACKAARERGLITSYGHTFTSDDALRALTLRPVMFGLAWHAGFDVPDSSGRVHLTGAVRGGHEVCLVGLDTVAQTVTALNSWGSSWGRSGFFTFSWDDFGSLLADQGDITSPVR